MSEKTEPVSEAAPTDVSPRLETDANMTVTNDFPDEVGVTVSDNEHMSSKFPGVTNLSAGASYSAYIQANNAPRQSSFVIQFPGPTTFKVDIGRGIYQTQSTPPYASDGLVGVLLAPGKPIHPGVDYKFLFFTGPAQASNLANSFIQANLPAILTYINSSSVTVSPITGLSLTLDAINVDPANVSVSYAAFKPLGPEVGNGNLWNMNAVFNVTSCGINGSAQWNLVTSGHAQMSIGAEQLAIYVQAQIDPNTPTNSQVTALQISLKDFYINQDLLKLLLMVPLLAPVIAGIQSDYVAAGLINTYFNDKILDAINSAISGSASLAALTSSKHLKHDQIPMQIDTKLQASSNLPQDINLAAWMSSPQIQNFAILSYLFIPGTHDSATYGLQPYLSQVPYPDIAMLWNLNPGTAPSGGSSFPLSWPPTSENPLYVGQALWDFAVVTAVQSSAQAQNQTILQQLESGIRHLDLRVYWDDRGDGGFFTQHALQGPPLSDILADLQTFVQQTSPNGELIFAVISHTNFDAFPNQKQALLNLISQYIPENNLFYRATPAGQTEFNFDSLANLPLASLTGGVSRVMFINSDYESVSYDSIITNTSGYRGAGWQKGINTLAELITQQQAGLSSHNGTVLYAVNWTLELDSPTIVNNILQILTGVTPAPLALQGAATAANAAFPGFINQNGGNNAGFGLATLDWSNCDVGGMTPAEFVIGLNWRD